MLTAKASAVTRMTGAQRAQAAQAAQSARRGWKERVVGSAHIHRARAALLREVQVKLNLITLCRNRETSN